MIYITLKKKKLLTSFLSIIIIISSIIFTTSILKKIANTQINPLMIVSSESMESAIEAGDAIYIEYKDPSDICNGTVNDLKGDIIVYNPQGLLNHLPKYNQNIVHRVIGKMYNNSDNMFYFMTKGDNNNISDSVWIPESHVYGVVVKIIPKIGLLNIWLIKPFVYVPLIFIIGILYTANIIYEKNYPKEKTKELVCDTKDVHIGKLQLRFDTNCK